VTGDEDSHATTGAEQGIGSRGRDTTAA
jgi:hypothetical protein